MTLKWVVISLLFLNELLSIFKILHFLLASAENCESTALFCYLQVGYQSLKNTQLQKVPKNMLKKADSSMKLNTRSIDIE